MSDLTTLKPKDLVVRYGKVLKVLKITKKEIELQPYFVVNKNNQITYTVQLQKTNRDYIRPLSTKKEVSALLKELSKASELTKDYLKIQSNPKTNTLKDSLSVIKALIIEKKNNDGVLPSGKMNIYKLAMNQATEEIAACNKIKPENAEKLILKFAK